jgi:hypothetical protein
MRHLGLFLAAALAAASPALADTPGIDKPGAAPKTPPAPKIPQSVWNVGSGREGVEHVQSGMLCERQVYAYKLIDLHVYDGFGLDVSCGYNDRDRTLTIYLTRAPEKSDAAATYASAKDALVKGSPQRHPTLVAEDKVPDGAITWLRATYAEDGGLHSSVWIAMLSPRWIFEYRATYPVDAEPTVNAALAKISRMVQDSAGPRLKLCAAHAAPIRDGVAVTDAEELRTQATLTSILGGAEQANAQKGEKSAAIPPAAWCPEATFQLGNIWLLFWRGVLADGSDANADRVTGMTMGRPPELQIVMDPLANLVQQEKAKSTNNPKPRDRWTAMTHSGSQTWIYGYFDGRPTQEMEAALFADALQGKTKPIGGYSAEGKNITINMPPKDRQ